MNKKLFFIAPITIASVLCASCNHTHYLESIHWSGEHGKYEPSYEKYSAKSILANEAMTQYFAQNNVNQMLCQDILWSANGFWEKADIAYSFSVNLSKVDKTTMRLSFNLKISDPSEKKHCLEIFVNNLEYSYYCDEEFESNILFFLPANMQYSDGVVIIDPLFWKDAHFTIDVKEWNPDGSVLWQRHIDFNFLDPDEQWVFQFEYAQFLILKPYFFSQTQILK